MPLIKFEPFNAEIAQLYECPKPASASLPHWYREAPLHLDGDKETGLSATTNAVSNLTIKGCSPFLDALTTGYMFVLPFDVEFRRNAQGMTNVRWATNMNLIGGHAPEQAPGLPTPFNGSPTILKWSPGWRVSTPAGYSSIFTHPFNRADLPFQTMTGVVDTDTYSLGVDIPFQLLNINRDIFILEKGTPICQVIPFKRDDWESETLEFDEESNKKGIFALKSKIVRSYRTQYWQKKSYK